MDVHEEEPIIAEVSDEAETLCVNSSDIRSDNSFVRASGGTIAPEPAASDDNFGFQDLVEAEDAFEPITNPEDPVRGADTCSPPVEPAQKRRKIEIPCSYKNVLQKTEHQFCTNKSASMRDLDVSPRVLEILLRRFGSNLTIPSLLITTKADLRSVGLTGEEADDVLRQAAALSCGRNFSGRTMLSLFRWRTAKGQLQTFSCPVLDDFFRGGLPIQHLTEFAGPAGTGKTQVCLQLSLAVQLPVDHGGLEGECLYINTETSFPSRRLKQISDNWSQRTEQSGISPPSMDSIFVETLDTLSKVETFLTERIHILLAIRPVKLVIIDSIANIFRFSEEDRESYQKRAQGIQKLGNLLRNLQNTYALLIVCTNQVSAVIDGVEPTVHPRCADAVVPSLGISWANFVSTRVMLAKSYQPISEGDATVVRRSMSVLFAPHLPSEHQAFKVTTNGVFGVR